MSNTTNLDIVDELESFLYTPYGVSTVAGAAILLTSLLWIVGCCCCCYCYLHRRRSYDLDGVLEANRDLDYYGVVSVPAGLQGNGTLSSGYNTALTDSLDSHAGTNAATLTTSLDSILHKEV